MAYLIIFFLGAIFGSFVNVLVYRTIRNESIIYPPSHCDSCNKRLRPYELVPIVSYLLQKGRCRTCGSKIPRTGFLLELLAGLIALGLCDSNAIGKSIMLFIAAMLALAIALIDLETFDIYMVLIGLLSLLGLVYRYLFIGYSIDFFIKIIIFIIAYGLIYLIAKGGLGDGDIYFYLALFLFIENHLILWMVLISIWLGAGVGIIIAIKEKSSKIPLPFCIFIFISFLIVNMW